MRSLNIILLLLCTQLLFVGCSSSSKRESDLDNLRVAKSSPRVYTLEHEHDSMSQLVIRDLKRSTKVLNVDIEVYPVTYPLLIAKVDEEISLEKFRGSSVDIKKLRKEYLESTIKKWKLEDTSKENSSCFGIRLATTEYVSGRKTPQRLDPKYYSFAVKTEDKRTLPLRLSQADTTSLVGTFLGKRSSTIVERFSTFLSACTEEEIQFDRPFIVVVRPRFAQNIPKESLEIELGWLVEGSDFGR